MANRVIRDWTDSEKMNSLSIQAECLFVRLIMKADDFGNFHANVKLIKSLCFPLKDFRESDISRWLNELQSSGLIAFYTAENKKFLSILNFGQRLRNMRNAFPQSTENQSGGQSAANCGDSPPETETETETETENPQTPKGGSHEKIDFQKLLDFINKKTGRKFKLIDEATKRKYNSRLKDGYSKQDILTAISNAVNDDFHKEKGLKFLTPEYFSRAKTIDTHRSLVRKKEVVISKNEGFSGPFDV